MPTSRLCRPDLTIGCKFKGDIRVADDDDDDEMTQDEGHRLTNPDRVIHNT